VWGTDFAAGVPFLAVAVIASAVLWLLYAGWDSEHVAVYGALCRPGDSPGTWLDRLDLAGEDQAGLAERRERGSG
jgi:hypothetical protein